MVDGGRGKWPERILHDPASGGKMLPFQFDVFVFPDFPLFLGSPVSLKGSSQGETEAYFNGNSFQR